MAQGPALPLPDAPTPLAPAATPGDVTFQDFFDSTTGRTFAIAIPGGLSGDQRLSFVQDKLTALRALPTPSPAPGPTQVETVGRSLGQAAVEAAPEALAAAAGGAVPVAGGLAAQAVKRGLLTGAGALFGRQATKAATQQRFLTPTEALATFAGGAVGQVIPELVLGGVALSAAEQQQLARGIEQAITAQGFRREAAVATQAGAQQRAAGLTAQRLQTQAAQRTAADEAARLEAAASSVGPPAVAQAPQPAGTALKLGLPGALGRVRGQKNRLYDRLVTQFGDRKLPAFGSDVVRSAEGALQQLDTLGIEEAQKSRVKNVLAAIVERGTPQQVPTGLFDPQGRAITTTKLPEPLTYRELNAWGRDLQEVLPPFARRGQSTSFARGSLERVYRVLDETQDGLLSGTAGTQLKQKADNYYIHRYLPLREATRRYLRDGQPSSEVVDALVNEAPETLVTLLGKGTASGTLDPAIAGKVRQAVWTRQSERFRDPVTEAFDADGFVKWWRQVPPSSQRALAGPGIGDVQRFMGQLRDTVLGRDVALAQAKALGVTAKTIRGEERRFGKLAAGAGKEAEAADAMLGDLQRQLNEARGGDATTRTLVARGSAMIHGLTLLAAGHPKLGLAALLTGELAAPTLGRVLAKPGLSRLALRMIQASPQSRAAGRFGVQFVRAFLTNVGEPLPTQLETPTGGEVAVER